MSGAWVLLKFIEFSRPGRNASWTQTFLDKTWNWRKIYFNFPISPVNALLGKSSGSIFFSRRGKASSVRNWLHLAGWPSLSDGWPTWPTPCVRSPSGCLPTHRYHQWQVITLCLILLPDCPRHPFFSIQLFSSLLLLLHHSCLTSQLHP